ncbi:zinc-binding dehydrogenase [Lactiplantibacillus sp. WILCCON 0030]|uniref:Zinc-binding dehydrogenase n=1 Tax=Lactiplantibacillus brownii TaxID=3069269 RepID=A0ABU1AAN6_9LACO|nr:zinc-binding dehydrogenase [Lactiplantibacillus brownii]MDQ7937948.1 zinc-binding dehydrogenase [Lactiplantibacillus brownii]
MMRAVVIEQPGDPDVMNLVERPIPQPTASQSVMRIHAFGVHRYEVLTRAGGSPSVKFPRVIGVEAVGEISATSTNSSLKVGQKVITMMGGFGREVDGSYQDYALVDDQHLFPVAYTGDWVSLAQYPENFYTAIGAIKSLNLQAGQTLLIRGGTSAVGLAAIKLAKAFGLTVTATTRRPNMLAALTRNGADEAILDQNNELVTDASFDGIVDMVGTVTLTNSIAHLNQGGKLSLIGLLAGEWIVKNFNPFILAGKSLTVFDSTEVKPALVTEMFAMIAKYKLSIPIAKVFKLPEIRAAHDYVMASRDLGQVIVDND